MGKVTAGLSSVSAVVQQGDPRNNADGVRTGLDPVPTASPTWAVGSKLGNSKVSFRATLKLYPQNH